MRALGRLTGNWAPSDVVGEAVSLLTEELAIIERYRRLMATTGARSQRDLRSSVIMMASAEQRSMIATLSERVEELKAGMSIAAALTGMRR